MIFLNRPPTPTHLKQIGAQETQRLIDLFDSDRDCYISGEVAFQFDPKIYGHQTVKDLLADEVQFGKCCFCEGKVTSYGHVEHFRPKGGYQQTEDEPLQHPGYYWLAYEWTNLMFSCERCNTSYKKNYFPLVDPTRRATDHTKDIAAESPLLINPYEENPELYIEYVGTNPVAMNGNSKALETIKRTGINDLGRKVFFEVRLDHYLNMKLLYEAYRDLDNDNPTRDKIKLKLDEAVSNKAQFSLMTKCAIRDGFVY